MTKNCDWYNTTFYSGKKNNVPINLTIQDMDQGIGYMNRRLQNLINCIVKYLVEEGRFKKSQIDGIEKQFMSLDEKEFKAKSFGGQIKILFEFEKEIILNTKESDSLEQIRKDRNYFIHKFCEEYSKDEKIEDNQFLRLKKTISSINKATNRFDSYVKQSQKKKTVTTTPKRKRISEDDMKNAIIGIINEYHGNISLQELDLELRIKYGTIEWGTWYGHRFKNCLIKWGLYNEASQSVQLPSGVYTRCIW